MQIQASLNKGPKVEGKWRNLTIQNWYRRRKVKSANIKWTQSQHLSESLEVTQSQTSRPRKRGAGADLDTEREKEKWRVAGGGEGLEWMLAGVITPVTLV